MRNTICVKNRERGDRILWPFTSAQRQYPLISHVNTLSFVMKVPVGRPSKWTDAFPNSNIYVRVAHSDSSIFKSKEDFSSLKEGISSSKMVHEIMVGFTSRQGLLQLMPAREECLVTIIVLLSVLTWIFSGRTHSGHHIQPSQLSSSITPEGRQYLHDLS